MAVVAAAAAELLNSVDELVFMKLLKPPLVPKAAPDEPKAVPDEPKANVFADEDVAPPNANTVAAPDAAATGGKPNAVVAGAAGFAGKPKPTPPIGAAGAPKAVTAGAPKTGAAA